MPDQNDESRRWAQCVGKHPYAAADTAWRVARRQGHGLTAYRCRFCGFWHIGHKKRGKRPRRPPSIVS